MANGFYGNISNVSKTQMQIDKIYPSRLDMDENASTDSVALERYVLVEYGPKLPSYFHLYNNQLYVGYPRPYLAASAQKVVKKDDKVVILPPYERSYDELNEEGKLETKTEYVYHTWKMLDGKLVPDENENLFGVYRVTDDNGTVEKSTSKEDKDYNEHYKKDRNIYGNARGYDSTVWMKVLKDGVYSYEYVADLNTVMPTFIMSVDAPKEDQALNIPYMVERNDMLYDLHIHPAPKFRVKASEGKSDFGDKNIYFNEAGFNVNKKSEELEIQDEIKVEYSGTSGDVYSNGAEAVDTHELSILLPSIGNTISKVWDLVYKPDGEGNRDTTIQSDSLFDGENYDMSTIAGCIRTAQDVLGQDMIKEGLPAEDQYTNEYDNAYIYKQDGKYYIIVKKYSPVYSNTNELVAWNEDGYELKVINLNEPINSIFGAMAQMNQELNIAEEKIGAYYQHLDNAVKNLLTFKTFNFDNWLDDTGNAGTSISIEARNLSDSLSIETSGALFFENSESDNSVKLSLSVEKELKETDNPISSKVVKTEVDNITSLIGDVKAILEAINGQTVEPLIDYNDIAIDTEEILWD